MSAAFPGGNPSDPGYWEVIFDVIPFPVYVADSKTYDIICANRAMMQRVAVKPGDKCHAAIYQQAEPCTFCRMQELEGIAACGTNYLEFELFNDIDDRWYQLRETMVAWFDGRRAKYSIAVDISALKEVQNALAEAHAELALKNRRLNGALLSEQEVTLNQRNFLAMVSHEFRMPLSIIGGAAQVLELYVGDKPEPREEIAKIDRAVHRMSDLIDVCLADERFTSAVAALQPSPLDLAPLIEDILREKTELAGPERLHLTIDAPVTACADQALLRVAVSNLLDNALKYSPPGSGPVRIALERGPAEARIIVTDNGPGIPADEVERIFEKFYRCPSATGTKGAGLGLYIVKRIAESHGGRIMVEPGSAGGSVFTISLPVEKA
ncbi:two-component sensor histidine kinase [Magnetospirillum sp. ME-1]|uniref:sensor histidine kinase n=1 Tax=Magnetospirillum sp. ME-1 TaxID=1639348 RepID=UPI000A17E809|nr:HAMP domain-containing sensor histidine kinase [Magnetospirillum sp. ME-1]ARJ65251.1 two-component sensor histidine kinase [Magnetospirillum sp. ME-1]